MSFVPSLHGATPPSHPFISSFLLFIQTLSNVSYMSLLLHSIISFILLFIFTLCYASLHLHPHLILPFTFSHPFSCFLYGITPPFYPILILPFIFTICYASLHAVNPAVYPFPHLSFHPSPLISPTRDSIP